MKNKLLVLILLALPAIGFSQTDEESLRKAKRDSVIKAQEVIRDSIFQKLIKVNFAVPDLPAFNILGNSPTDILRPTDVKALSILTSDFYNGSSIIVPKSFAMELSPLLLAKSNSLTLNDYQRNKFWYNFRLSLGTNTTTSNNQKYSNLAIGARIVLVDKGDLKNDEVYIDIVKNSLKLEVDVENELKEEYLLKKNKTIQQVAIDSILTKEMENYIAVNKDKMLDEITKSELKEKFLDDNNMSIDDLADNPKLNKKMLDYVAKNTELWLARNNKKWAAEDELKDKFLHNNNKTIQQVSIDLALNKAMKKFIADNTEQVIAENELKKQFLTKNNKTIQEVANDSALNHAMEEFIANSNKRQVIAENELKEEFLIKNNKTIQEVAVDTELNTKMEEYIVQNKEKWFVKNNLKKEFLSRGYIKDIPKFKEKYKKEYWNKQKLEFAYAYLGSSPDSLIKNIQSKKHSAWLTGALPLGKGTQLLMGLNYSYIYADSLNKEADKTVNYEYNTFSISSRLYFGTNRIKGFVEGQYKSISLNSKKDAFVNAGGEFNIRDGIWLVVNAGVNWHDLGSSNSKSGFYSSLNLRFTLPENFKLN